MQSLEYDSSLTDFWSNKYESWEGTYIHMYECVSACVCIRMCEWGRRPWEKSKEKGGIKRGERKEREKRREIKIIHTDRHTEKHIDGQIDTNHSLI